MSQVSLSLHSSCWRGNAKCLCPASVVPGSVRLATVKQNVGLSGSSAQFGWALLMFRWKMHKYIGLSNPREHAEQLSKVRFESNNIFFK